MKHSGLNLYHHNPPNKYRYDLSIIVTFYNQEQFVDDVFDSILKQETEFSYEIIVGDDGSDDSSVDLINYWTSKFPSVIKFFNHTSDKRKYTYEKASNHRVFLMQKATGKYLCFLDGDDLFLGTNKIQNQISILKQNEDSSICLSGYVTNRDECNLVASLRYHKLSPRYYWSKKYYEQAGSIVFKNKEILLCFDYFDDNGIMISFLDKNDIYVLENPTLLYRQHSDNTWCKMHNCEQFLYVAKLYIVSLAVNPTFAKETRRRFNEFLINSFKLRKCFDGIANTQDLIILSNFKYLQYVFTYNTINFWKKLYVIIFYTYFVSFRVFIKVLSHL